MTTTLTLADINYIKSLIVSYNQYHNQNRNHNPNIKANIALIKFNVIKNEENNIVEFGNLPFDKITCLFGGLSLLERKFTNELFDNIILSTKVEFNSKDIYLTKHKIINDKLYLMVNIPKNNDIIYNVEFINLENTNIGKIELLANDVVILKDINKLHIDEDKYLGEMNIKNLDLNLDNFNNISDLKILNNGYKLNDINQLKDYNFINLCGSTMTSLSLKIEINNFDHIKDLSQYKYKILCMYGIASNEIRKNLFNFPNNYNYLNEIYYEDRQIKPSITRYLKN